MLFREIVPMWSADKKYYIKRSTLSAYLLHLQNHILPFFGGKERIEEHEVQDFVIKKLDQGISQKTIKDVIIVLKMVLKFGDKMKLFPYTPFELKFPTQSQTRKIEVLTKADHKKVMVYLTNNFSFRNLGLLICLSTGLRIGEVCALQWEDIDTDNGLITIRKTIQRIYTLDGDVKKTEIIIDRPKTQGSNREIPMSGELIRLIKPLKKIVRPDCYILTNELKPTEPRTYRVYYRELMKSLDLPVIKFHGLRHTFATRCIESKADIKTVSTILGHSKVGLTLDLYVHPNNEQKKNAIDQMLKSLR